MQYGYNKISDSCILSGKILKNNRKHLIGVAYLQVLPDEDTGPDQIAALRRMTPEQRWRAARELYWSARRLKAAYLRDQHADWSEDQIEREVRRIFFHARS